VLILEVAAAAGAAVEAQQHQMPIRIHSVAVDSVTVVLHLLPILRRMGVEAVVIVQRRQMLHQMQVQTLLEAEVVLH
jgi:hypothetical protein